MADLEKRDRGPYKRNRRGDYSHHQKQRKEDGNVSDPVEMTPALQTFKEYQTELDSKHDKYERLVKISRDVTIESKRIIFLLHRIQGDSEKVLEEAESRLAALQNNLISKIAIELKGEDLHRFLRAFSPGLQEFIEAVAFYLFIKEERLVSLEEVSSRLTFTEKQDEGSSEKEEVPQDKDTQSAPSATETDNSKEAVESIGHTETEASDDKDTKNELQRTSSPPQISLPIPPLEVMLGLADFTGELMRLCINTVGSGDLERPFKLLTFMRAVSEGFQLLGNVAGREMVRKSSVMRQSLKKMEDACYVIKVRGSEIPKHMLKDAIIIPSEFSSRSRDNGYEQEVM